MCRHPLQAYLRLPPLSALMPTGSYVGVAALRRSSVLLVLLVSSQPQVGYAVVVLESVYVVKHVRGPATVHIAPCEPVGLVQLDRKSVV